MKSLMGFSTKILLLTIVSATFIGAAFTINSAEAKSETDSAKSPPQSRNQDIHELSVKVTELNRKLSNADYRSSKKEEEIAEPNRKISELKDVISDSKKISFDSTSSVLNTLIALSALIITGVGVGFGFLAFYGLKGFAEVKTEINNQLKLTSVTIDEKLASESEKINGLISSKYKETVDEYFQSQNSPIHGKLDELEERINECCDKANTAEPVKNTPPATHLTQSGNAFDDVKL